MSDIGAIVKRLAAVMLPGWRISWEEVASADIGGALAMVYPTPAREMAHIKIAPHPPGESVEESIAHELAHAMISPLVALIDPTPAAVMIEEPIVERMSLLFAKLTGAAKRAAMRAFRNPRTKSPAVRARISALASGRLGNGRKRMLSAEQLTKALEALESGDPEATKAILKELIAAMATGGSDEPPQSQNEPHVTGRDPAEGDDMGGGQYRDEQDPEKMRGQRGRGKPQTELDKSLARTRKAERDAVSAARGAAQITIRARVKELRGEGITIDDATAQKLVALGDVDAAEERIGYLLKGRDTSTQRARTGAEADGARGNGGTATLDVAALIAEGLPAQLANEIVMQSKVDPAGAEAQRQAARARIAQRKNGGL